MNSTVFTTILFLIGVFLLWINFSIDKHSDQTCLSDKVRQANKVILAIGVSYIILSLTYATCKLKCNCDKVDVDDNLHFLFLAVTSIVLIILGSIINVSSKKNSCEKDTQIYSAFTVTSAVLMLVITGGAFYIDKKNIKLK